VRAEGAPWRPPPQVGDDAAEGEYRHDEEHGAGVLGERADHTRGEPSGEGGLPYWVATDGGEQALAVTDSQSHREEREGGCGRHRVIVQLVPRGIVAADHEVAYVARRARVEHAAGEVAAPVGRREI
jgi:hypothetical protein